MTLVKDPTPTQLSSPAAPFPTSAWPRTLLSVFPFSLFSPVPHPLNNYEVNIPFIWLPALRFGKNYVCQPFQPRSSSTHSPTLPSYPLTPTHPFPSHANELALIISRKKLNCKNLVLDQTGNQ